MGGRADQVGGPSYHPSQMGSQMPTVHLVPPPLPSSSPSQSPAIYSCCLLTAPREGPLSPLCGAHWSTKLEWGLPACF